MSSENNRIVKNTLFMYLRMLLVMAMTLYTSRVVLHVLGVDNYGIYNVVGGVVVLFTFINQAMATATQRFFSYELGKDEKGDISKIFSISLRIHLCIAGIILILAETIGLWFLNTKMNFLESSMYDVNWVYQLSIATCLLNILRVPYNGLVISYERMSFLALNSIMESILKLIIVFLLLITLVNKLILYSFLTLVVTGLITVEYIVFSKKNFKEVKYRNTNYCKETVEIIKFSGWATFGSVANVGYQQGINILLNIGYGVVVNAAAAIATQIYVAIFQFVGGFQQALNPQLIKTESQHNVNRQQSLIFRSAKFSFFIMLIIAIPIIVNMSYILTFWLGEYPIQTIQFSQLIIIGALIECLSGPLWVTIFATGKIRLYQIIVSIVLLLNLPFSYILIKADCSPSVVFVVRIALFIIALIVRLIFLRKLTNLSILEFVHKVILPIIYVMTPLAVISYGWINFIGISESFGDLIWQSLTLIISSIIMTGFWGLTKEEKEFLFGIIQSRMRKRNSL